MDGQCEVQCDERRSRTVVLPDGRRLGYAEWGSPDGWPVLFFHGTPSSRLGLEWLEDIAAAQGARVISLDRPGHGLSDRAPGRTLLGWSRDVADAADALGLTNFSVAGWSGGGPYVLACAAGIPERVTAAAVLSGCGPFDEPAARRSVSSIDRTMLKWSRRAPFVARLLMQPVVHGTRRAPGVAIRSMEKDLSPRDIEIFRRLNPEPTRAMGFFLEAFRSGTAGVIDDYRLLASPWDFAPEEIAIPVHFWHGDADRMAGIADARALADRIPGARFNVVPDAGHLLLMEHASEVLAALAP